MLLVYLALCLFRAPKVIWPGRFWAEEGVIYFREAFSLPFWEVIGTANLGYYSLWNKMASITAAYAVPLRFAPFICVLFALAVQLLPAWLLLYARVPALGSRLRQVAAVALVLLVQPNQEVWLNTINSQFFLGISTAIILISTSANRLTRTVRLGALVIAGLTGVVSCVLTPFFWFEYACSRNKQKLYEALALTCACILQAAIVLGSPERATHWHPVLLAFVLLTKQWILPVLGHGAAASFATHVVQHQLYTVELLVPVILLPYLLLGFALTRWGSRHAWLLFGAAILIASLSFLRSLPGTEPNWILGHLSTIGGGRYYFAPNVLLGLVLLMAPRQVGARRTHLRGVFRATCVLLVVMMITVGAYDYVTSKQRHLWFFDGPSWPVEVQNWETNRADRLQIWPRPWSMELPKADGQDPSSLSPGAESSSHHTTR